MGKLFLCLLLSLSFISAQAVEFAPPYSYVNQLIEFEQRLNDRVEHPDFESNFEVELPREYLPENQPEFPILTVLVPSHRLEVIDTSANQISHGLRVKKNSRYHYKFFIHPVSRNRFKNLIQEFGSSEDLLATPLASHRSVVAWAPKATSSEPYFLKLSLDAEIAGVRRLLTRAQIERAAAASLAFREANMSLLNRHGIHIVDEPVSIYLKDSGLGYSLRESVALSENQELVPMFSLYAHKGNGSLLKGLIRKSRLSPREFAREKIILPMIKQMFIFAFQEGLVPDPHEQNVMVLLENNNWTGQFYYRDAAGFNINPDLRSLAGKDMSFVPNSFNVKSLGLNRANLVEKIYTYLVDSNFYALGVTLQKIDGHDHRAWILKTSREAIEAELFLRTGLRGRNKRAQTAVMTKFLKRKMERKECVNLFQ